MKNKQFDKAWVPAKYLNRYFKLKASADMQALNLYPNVKEILFTIKRVGKF